MAAAVFTASPEVLLERYGVPPHKVFGHARPTSGKSVSSRCHSAGSLGSRPRAPATAPAGSVTAERHGAGFVSGGSLCSSARSVLEMDDSPTEMVRCSSAGGVLASTCVAPTRDSKKLVSEAEGGGQMKPFSVGELRALFGKSSAKGKAPRALEIANKPAGSYSPQILSTGPVNTDGAPVLSSKAKATPKDQLKLKVAAPPRRSRLSHKDASKRQPSTEDAAGSGEGEFDFELNDDEGEEDGVENRVANLGRARQKKGKPGAHFNPFVEFEDREQRLMCERRWLQDDDVYLRERVRGMRVDSVQARLFKTSLSGDALYQNVVHFSTYAIGLRARSPKRSDMRRASSAAPPATKSRGSVTAGTLGLDPEHHSKTKKGQGDKAVPTKETMWLKTMQADLKESIRGADYFL